MRADDLRLRKPSRCHPVQQVSVGLSVLPVRPDGSTDSADPIDHGTGRADSRSQRKGVPSRAMASRGAAQHEVYENVDNARLAETATNLYEAGIMDRPGDIEEGESCSSCGSCVIM